MIQQLPGYNSLQYLWRDRQIGNRTVRPSIWRVQIRFLETWRDVSFCEYIRNRLIGQWPVKQFRQEGNNNVGDSLKLSSWQRVERAAKYRNLINVAVNMVRAHTHACARTNQPTNNDILALRTPQSAKLFLPNTDKCQCTWHRQVNFTFTYYYDDFWFTNNTSIMGETKYFVIDVVQSITVVNLNN